MKSIAIAVIMIVSAQVAQADLCQDLNQVFRKNVEAYENAHSKSDGFYYGPSRCANPANRTPSCVMQRRLVDTEVSTALGNATLTLRSMSKRSCRIEDSPRWMVLDDNGRAATGHIPRIIGLRDLVQKRFPDIKPRPWLY